MAQEAADLLIQGVLDVRGPFFLQGVLFVPGTSMAIGNVIGGGALPGSVLFVGAGGILQQDNPQLFYDDAANILLVGSNVPIGFFDTKLEVFRTGHCVVSIVSVTAASDAVLILGTLTAPTDSAIFLDESDAQKLKFALGDVNGDALRNAATKLTIQQNGNVGIGVTTIGNHRLRVAMDASGQECVRLDGLAADNYADMVWFDSAAVEKGGIGYANVGVANTLAGRNFFYSPGAVDWIFSDATTDWVRIYATTNSVGLELANGSASGLSAAGKARIRYNSGAGTLQVSFNGGAYVTFVTI